MISEKYSQTGIPENHHDYLAAAQTHIQQAKKLQGMGFPIEHPLVQHHFEQHRNAAKSAGMRQP